MSVYSRIQLPSNSTANFHFVLLTPKLSAIRFWPVKMFEISHTGQTRRKKEWLLSILTGHVANHPSSLSAEPRAEDMDQRGRMIFDRSYWLQNQSATSGREWVEKRTNSCTLNWLQSESTRKLIGWIRWEGSGKEKEWSLYYRLATERINQKDDRLNEVRVKWKREGMIAVL